MFFLDVIPLRLREHGARRLEQIIQSGNQQAHLRHIGPTNRYRHFCPDGQIIAVLDRNLGIVVMRIDLHDGG